MPPTWTDHVVDADRVAEHSRLIPQSRLADAITEPLLREAGLLPGMHVVDLGSGAGDSTLLAARIVGPNGSVLGIERAAEAVTLARRRAADVGFDNVTFVEGDVAAVDEVLAERDVDAVIGRLILMWVPDRLAVLRACAGRLPPGALVWFLEPDMAYDDTVPGTPLWDRVSGWIEQAGAGLGVEPRMGPRLHGAFRAAGLPAPELRGRTLLSGAQTAPVWYWVNVVRGLLPALERLGIATPGEVDIDTLNDRLTAELVAVDGVAIIPPFTAAWARIPG